MWFKQFQIFQFTTPFTLTAEKIISQLTPLSFEPCLPSLPISQGWVAPRDVEDAPLVHSLNNAMMLCLQVEEKLLPATVVRQEVATKVKKLEAEQARKVGQKEKLNLKDEVTFTLLPRAFSKLNRIYAYIDSKNQRLILGTTNAKSTETFISFFERSLSYKLERPETKKLTSIFTQWLQTQQYPQSFGVEKACVLFDPELKSRVIRCQEQNLFTTGVQSFIKEGCEIKQLALSWQDRVRFLMADDFSLRNLKLHEDIILDANNGEGESDLQKFDANFFMMTETLAGLIDELYELFVKE